jgi:hypothetical protein
MPQLSPQVKQIKLSDYNKPLLAGAPSIFPECYGVTMPDGSEQQQCGTPIVGITDSCSCPKERCKTRSHHDPPGWGCTS